MVTKRNEQEHQEQCAFIEWRDAMKQNIPELARIYANPNGGERNARVGAKMKREGQSKGMLDITWPLPRSKYCGFYHELKVKYRNGRTNTPSTEQLEWIEYLNSVGYLASWSVGWESMKQAVLDYYDLGPSIYFSSASLKPVVNDGSQSIRPHRGRYRDILRCLGNSDDPVNTSYIANATGIKITSLHKTLKNMKDQSLINYTLPENSKRKLWFMNADSNNYE